MLQPCCLLPPWSCSCFTLFGTFNARCLLTPCVVLTCSEHVQLARNIYGELVGEFGRAVGGTISALGALANGRAGRLLNPVNLGVDVLNFNINNIISFLEVSRKTLL